MVKQNYILLCKNCLLSSIFLKLIPCDVLIDCKHMSEENATNNILWVCPDRHGDFLASNVCCS